MGCSVLEAPLPRKIKKEIKIMKTRTIGRDCPKCGRPMERRKHGANETEHRNKNYYFSEWDYCPICRHVQHYEEFKVYRLFQNKIAPFVKKAWEL